MIPSTPAIHIELANVFSLIFLSACFLGLVVWITYIAVTQRRLMKNMVTRVEFNKAFEDFRKEFQG